MLEDGARRRTLAVLHPPIVHTGELTHPSLAHADSQSKVSSRSWTTSAAEVERTGRPLAEALLVADKRRADNLSQLSLSRGGSCSSPLRSATFVISFCLLCLSREYNLNYLWISMCYPDARTVPVLRA